MFQPSMPSKKQYGDSSGHGWKKELPAAELQRRRLTTNKLKNNSNAITVNDIGILSPAAQGHTRACC
jgi:hypothetical protein